MAIYATAKLVSGKPLPGIGIKKSKFIATVSRK
jgi:hypothetical protein